MRLDIAPAGKRTCRSQGRNGTRFSRVSEILKSQGDTKLSTKHDCRADFREFNPDAWTKAEMEREQIAEQVCSSDKIPQTSDLKNKRKKKLSDLSSSDTAHLATC